MQGFQFSSTSDLQRELKASLAALLGSVSIARAKMRAVKKVGLPF
jgi:hypothetical protein